MCPVASSGKNTESMLEAGVEKGFFLDRGKEKQVFYFIFSKRYTLVIKDDDEYQCYIIHPDYNLENTGVCPVN